MRFEHEGMALWFGTPDAPAPKVVEAGEETTVTIGVKPTDASNKIEVLYRINKGSAKQAPAKWRRNDAAGKSYFSAVLPGFRAGETVEYTAVCRCAGRQVPPLDEAFQSAASFKVVEAQNDGNDGKIKIEGAAPNQPITKSAGGKTGTAQGQMQHRMATAPTKALKAAGSNAHDGKNRGGNEGARKATSAQAAPKSSSARGSAAATIPTGIPTTGNGGFSDHAESTSPTVFSEPGQVLLDSEEKDEAGINLTSENGNENEEAYSSAASLREEATANQSDDDNLTTEDAGDLDDAEIISASSYDIEPAENNFQVRGRLSGGDGEKFAEHRVVVSFRRKATMRDEDAAKSIWVSGEAPAQVAEDGSFTLHLPEKGKLESALAIKVLAPDGEILRHEKISHAELQDGLRLEVEAKRRRKIPRRDGRERREPGKLHGQVLDLEGKRKAVNKQVFLWACAKGANPKDFQLVFSARTDSQGYFFGDYPHGKFEEAYGVVAVGGKEKVPVRLKENGVFPHKVILGITMPEAKTADEDCSCKALVPRHPDSQDLVNSPETYSVDIGSNGCVNFTAPNRTLEEFSFYSVVRSTDPEIKGFYQPEPGKLPDKLREKLAGLGKGEAGRQAGKKLLHDYRNKQMADFEAQQEKHPGRGLLNARNPVDWENEVPGFCQATTIAHGHLLHFKQIWMADGYSLGDLLYSLPLAPCQKKQIAIVDWQRREKNKREEQQRAGDEMDAELSRNRDISEIVKSALSEESEGGSSATTASVGGGGGGIIGSAVIGVSGGYSNSNSEAWQESARNLAASSLQQLSDKTKQSASSLRTQRATVVQTADQKEDVEVTTEVIANHNHCHAMTMEYFEVLRHYRVEQELVEVKECLFVPLLMSRFDFAKTQRWRDTLRRCLRKDKLKKGFPAINRIMENYRGSDLPKGRYAEEIIQYLDGQLSISFEIFRPPDNKNGEFVPENWRRVMPFLDAGLQRLYNQFMNTTEPEEQSGGSLLSSIAAATTAVVSGGASLALLHMYGGEDSGEELTFQQARDLIFEKELAPRIAQGILESIEFSFVGTSPISRSQHSQSANDVINIFGMSLTLPNQKSKSGTAVSLDPTLVSKYVTGKPLHVRLQPGAPPPRVAREDITFFEMRLNKELPPFARVIIHSGALHYRTEHMSHTLFNSGRINNLLDNDSPVMINTPLDPEEERNPRAEDRQIALELVEHLNEYLVFYHLCIYRAMNRQHLYMLLDGFEIAVFDGERKIRRSLASVIENRLIGIAGNSLIFPVASGYHLDPTFEVESNEAVDLLSHYAPTTPVPPMRISVPTPGVYAEAVMGKCNSCEVKDDTRFWRWEESPCGDEPAAIQAPSTESRRAEPPSLAPTPLAQPIISMQTAPEAPAPTGLASAMQLLGTPNLFKDITGLDLNQQNAMSALSASLETAKSFGGMALQLEQQKLANQAQLEQQKAASQAQVAQQSASSSNLNNQLQHIQQAQKDGHLTPQQASELTRQALSRDIGATTSTAGGDKEASPGSPEGQKTDDGTLKDETSSDDSTGHTGQVPKCEEITTSGPNDYEVKDVKLFTQPSAKTCWAAAATMLVSWRRKELDSIEKVMEEAGQQYLTKFKQQDEKLQGLLGSEKGDFLKALGLVAEPLSLAAKNTEVNASTITYPDGKQKEYPPIEFYDPSTFLNLLKDYGPLWITTDAAEGEAFSAHARIVTGIFGDFNDESYKNIKLKILDPNPGPDPESPNKQCLVETYFNFMQKYGDVLNEDMTKGRNLRPQIVHLAASGPTTGSSDDGEEGGSRFKRIPPGPGAYTNAEYIKWTKDHPKYSGTNTVWDERMPCEYQSPKWFWQRGYYYAGSMNIGTPTAVVEIWLSDRGAGNEYRLVRDVDAFKKIAAGQCGKGFSSSQPRPKTKPVEQKTTSLSEADRVFIDEKSRYMSKLQKLQKLIIEQNESLIKNPEQSAAGQLYNKLIQFEIDLEAFKGKVPDIIEHQEIAESDLALEQLQALIDSHDDLQKWYSEFMENNWGHIYGQIYGEDEPIDFSGGGTQ